MFITTETNFNNLSSEKGKEINRKFLLGKAIANMYIAAQHTDQNASNLACDAIESADKWTKLGFNLIMSMSQYNIRA